MSKLTSLPLLLTLCAFSSCVLLDDGMFGYRTRTECGRDAGSGGDRRGDRPAAPAPLAQPDTLFYFSAVRFPDDYDWQRDTAYGAVPFELLLYENYLPVMALASGAEACFGPDPDRHHILSGHLYTERMTGSETLVGRDGVLLFRFVGREYLVGLLEDGESLYTLSRPASGRGFSLRRDGELLLQREQGTPFGDLTDPSYGPTGALYRDGGQVVFCYRSGEEGADGTPYLVQDGHPTPLESAQTAPLLDLKYSGGRTIELRTTLLSHRLTDGRIWPQGRQYAVTGRFADASGLFSGFLSAASLATRQRLCSEEATLYDSPRACYAVAPSQDGTVRWYGSDGTVAERTDCHFFCPACASLLDARFAIALSPRDARLHPHIFNGKEDREINLHGYVSRVAWEVRLPSAAN